MASFRLSESYVKRLDTAFKRYQRIRSLILRNVEDYIADFSGFRGTPQDRADYLEQKYRLREPKENYITALKDGEIVFHVRDIALLTGRDSSSVSRMLANMERSEGWYSRLVSLRHEALSANNNAIYTYSRGIFSLIVDYKEYLYLERIKRAGVADFAEVMRYWEYLKKRELCESAKDTLNVAHEGQDAQEQHTVPDIPPVSWKDVISIIGAKLFSVKADMIFALAFAVTFGLARRWTALIPVFAAVSGVLLIVCALLLRHRTRHPEVFADAGAVMTLLVLFWGVNLTMENGIYTPGGTVMNLSVPEPALRLEARRGEYMGWRGNPLVFFVNADNEAEISGILYRTDPADEYVSSGRSETGSVQLLLRPEIKADTITIDLKYADAEGKLHGPYMFTFDVEKERFASGKNAVINHPDILWLMPNGRMTVINSFMNDTVKAVHYGINTRTPDRVYVPDFDEGYHGDGSYVVDFVYERVDFVSLYTEFADGTSSDVHIKQAEGGRRQNPPAPANMSA